MRAEESLDDLRRVDVLVVELSQHLVAIALVRCESVDLDGIVQTNKDLGIIAALYGIGRELKNL